MRTYRAAVGRQSEVTHPHPERTAYRAVGWDLEYKVWPSRGAMVTTLRMQARSAPRAGDWRPLVHALDCSPTCPVGIRHPVEDLAY